MADKFHSDTKEKIELIGWTPHAQGNDATHTGDKEAGTKVVTLTAEASGVGNADYNHAMNSPQSPDARVIIRRMATRLRVTIDSMTAGTLYCRVYIDVQDTDHLIFDESWAADGDKLASEIALVGTKEIIFNLLKDGGSHTYYFFFWVDSGNAIISLVQLWIGVGNKGTGWEQVVLEFDHDGFATLVFRLVLIGSGSAGQGLWLSTTGRSLADLNATYLIKGAALEMRSSVGTDLYFIRRLDLVLRSEQ